MLKPESALRKDLHSRGELQHRHFATIAAVIREIPDNADRVWITHHFADRLASTNPRFDRGRFVRACAGEG